MSDSATIYLPVEAMPGVFARSLRHTFPDVAGVVAHTAAKPDTLTQLGDTAKHLGRLINVYEGADGVYVRAVDTETAAWAHAWYRVYAYVPTALRDAILAKHGLLGQPA